MKTKFSIQHFRQRRRSLGLTLVLIPIFLGLFGLAKSPQAAIIYASSCSAGDVNGAIGTASAGDTINIPSGNCTWTNTVSLDKAVTLSGAGQRYTIITLNADTGVSATASEAGFKNFTIVTDSNTPGNATFFAKRGTADRLVVVGMTFDETAKPLGYVFKIDFQENTTSAYAVIAGCTFLGWVGEQVNWRGPCNSWDTNHSMGGAQALFFEGNTVVAAPGQTGYFDSNANSRIVARYNKMTGVYFDNHGSWSNWSLCNPETSASARQGEFYNNRFIGGLGWTSIYIRGGTALIYNNTLENEPWGYIFLQDYYVGSTNGRLFPDGCACDADYPIVYQIGRGKNIVSSPIKGSDQNSEPLFIWNNKRVAEGSDIGIGLGYPISQTCKNYCNDQTETMADFIHPNQDYCLHNTTTACNGFDLSSYSAYTCPHPLTGYSGTCDPSKAGIEGYNRADTTPPAAPSGLTVK